MVTRRKFIAAAAAVPLLPYGRLFAQEEPSNDFVIVREQRATLEILEDDIVTARMLCSQAYDLTFNRLGTYLDQEPVLTLRNIMAVGPDSPNYVRRLWQLTRDAPEPDERVCLRLTNPKGCQALVVYLQAPVLVTPSKPPQELSVAFKFKGSEATFQLVSKA
jgi:hypothetical protein